MAQGTKLVGKLYVRVGGELLPITGDGAVTVYGLGRVERETKLGPDGPLGFIEKPVTPGVEANVQAGPGMTQEDLGAIEDATVTVETDTGQTHTLVNAWCVNAGELASGGEFKVKFEGMKWQGASGQTTAASGS
jgi:hypothetical protein